MKLVDQIFEIALQKVCLRRTFFNKVNSQSNKAVISSSIPKEEIAVAIDEEKKKV